VTLDGKYSFGPVTLYYQVPFGVMNTVETFNSALTPHQSLNFYERYAMLEYKDRFWKDRLGLNAKGFYIQFVRNIDTQVVPDSSLFPSFVGPDGKMHYGGVHFDTPDMLVQRFGGTFDIDLQLPYGLRPLVGGEVFYEGLSNAVASFPTQTNTDL